MLSEISNNGNGKYCFNSVFCFIEFGSNYPTIPLLMFCPIYNSKNHYTNCNTEEYIHKRVLNFFVTLIVSGDSNKKIIMYVTTETFRT